MPSATSRAESTVVQATIGQPNPADPAHLIIESEGPDPGEGVLLPRHQVALAEFGRFALESRDIERSVERAVDVIAEVLDAPVVALLELLGPGQVAVVHGRGRAGLTLDVQAPDPVEIGALGVSVAVPVDGRPWGRLIVSDDEPRRFGLSDVAFVQQLAEVLAAALERERAEAARAWLADLGHYALHERDVELTMQRAVDVVTRVLEVPIGCVLRSDDPGGPDPVTPLTMTMVQAWGPVGLQPGEQFPISAAVAAAHDTGVPLLVEDWDDVLFPIPRDARSRNAASLSVPVTMDGAGWGRLVVVDNRPRRFTEEEVRTATAVAAILTAALERDRMVAGLRRTAQDLQQALLPAALPRMPGLEAEARYAPASGEHVGGDWYDLLALPQGGTGLVMGDVEGHDSTAAAVMGQVRNVLRAYAAEGHAPAGVMARVNRFVAQHSDRLVTCCYAELGPAEPTLTWVTAGHPPPLVLGADGEVVVLQSAPGLLLGFDPDAAYADTTTLLPPGATVLLVTDGLIDEDDGGAVRPGVDAFAERVRALAGRPLGELAGALGPTGPAGRGPARDDAALLAVRSLRAGPGGVPQAGDAPAHRVFRPGAESTAAARRFVRDILAGWGLSVLEHSATLAVSELVTNTVLHTASPIHVTLRRSGGGGLWIGVYDDSDRYVRYCRSAGDDISGRGLMIVDTLADSWGVTPTPDGSGKTVWLELSQR
jgi:GAF domain-containing protein/anti-sigma regulatory factor (Ser/Thr protein kinase)